jgi:microcystin-dependent protein
MATDIKISELNEITINSDINHIIVNDRENSGDEGITKKIKLENFLTPNIVTGVNIINSAVTRDKVQDLSIDCSKIATNTITCNQIKACTINNPVLDSNSVDNRVLNNCCNFTVDGLLVNSNCVKIGDPAFGCLDVVSGVTKLANIRYNWPSVQPANKFLNTDGAGNLSWADAVPGDSTALVFAEIVPVGTIMPWAGTGDVPSDKWKPCDGGTFLEADFPELAAALGATSPWGVSGTSPNRTFTLPDLKGKVPVGKGSYDDGTTSCTFNFGAYGGEYKHLLTEAEMPSHNHDVHMTNDSKETPTSNWTRLAPGEGTTRTSGINIQICDTGSDQSHNNIQPYAVTKYIIKAKPDDIQQFNPDLGPGLSATDGGGQTSNLTLTATEIGLNVTDDFQFNGNGKLEIANVGFSKLDLPSNFPIQTVQSVKTDTQQLYGPDLGATSWEEISGLSKTLTRNIASSTGKVRIQGSISTSSNYSNGGVAVRLVRNGSVVANATGNAAGSRLRATGNAAYSGAHGNGNIVFDFIDTPGTAAANVTYSVEGKIYSSKTGWINRAYYDTDDNDYSFRVISTLTLTELTP